MIETVPRMMDYLKISEKDEKDITKVGKLYPWRLTEYYASLMNPQDSTCPIRLQAVPSILELDHTCGEQDPLCEEANSPVPGIIRVYPDRIAVIVTTRCPVYCRFCLRKRFERDRKDDLQGKKLQAVISYIRNNTSIRDVLLTGGDPFMMSDSELDEILGELSSIEHVDIIRIGTRTPCTWPERITESLAKMLSSHHPVWINTHFNHPAEITPDSERALGILLEKGIPIGNQSVLLRGVNDSVEVMMELVKKLVKTRVRPYYLYQAQNLAGTQHFIVTIEKGLDIIRGLRGYTTGFAVPQYVLDTPYGKIPLNPDYLKGRKGDYVELRSYNGKVWRELNPLK